MSKVKKIPLPEDKFAIVDVEDYPKLNRYKWYLGGGLHGPCAVRRCLREGKRVTIYMHREIMNAPGNMDVINKNYNRLDNRKANLRLCAIGHRSQRPSAHTTSKFKGVFWHKRDKKWAAQISTGLKRIWLGYFENELDAAMAYDAKAIDLFGEFAWLNLLKDGSLGKH